VSLGIDRVVVDTNVLLSYPQIITEHQCIILACVLREIEKHKISGNNELQYQARKASRYIKENEDKVTYDFKDYEFNLNSQWDGSYVDNMVLQVCVDNKYTLLTNDILLYLKAKGLGLTVWDYNADDGKDYTGYKEVWLTEEEVAELYSNLDINTYGLHTNEYLIVYMNESVVDKFRWNGKKLVNLKSPPQKIVKPWNDLQACALDLLMCKDIPVKIIIGHYGSGKSYLSTRIGLFQIDKGFCNKMLIVRNGIGPGERSGYLPGSKDEKHSWMTKAIEQQLDGKEQELQSLIQQGKVEIETPYYMKGMSLNDGYWMLVEEAEDMDTHIFKTVGSRIGKNSYAVFSGDYQQAESKFKHDNGLMSFIRKWKGNPLVGIVKLKEDVRSEASKLFADL